MMATITEAQIKAAGLPPDAKDWDAHILIQELVAELMVVRSMVCNRALGQRLIEMADDFEEYGCDVDELRNIGEYIAY